MLSSAKCRSSRYCAAVASTGVCGPSLLSRRLGVTAPLLTELLLALLGVTGVSLKLGSGRPVLPEDLRARGEESESAVVVTSGAGASGVAVLEEVSVKRGVFFSLPLLAGSDSCRVLSEVGPCGSTASAAGSLRGDCATAVVCLALIEILFKVLNASSKPRKVSSNTRTNRLIVVRDIFSSITFAPLTLLVMFLNISKDFVDRPRS